MILFKKPRRFVNRVFIHCSASDRPEHDNAETIRGWHVKERGWQDIGYHFVITKSNGIQVGRDIEKKPAAQAGHNDGTIAICLTGNDHFSAAQKEDLRDLCRAIDQAYNGSITFHGHKEVCAGKTCPNFEYKTVLMLDMTGHMRKLKVKVTNGGLFAMINKFFNGD